MKPEQRRQVDRAEKTLTVIGAKWKPAIMFCLVFEGRMRFRDLRAAIPQITQKMLTQRLRELERDGLVTRSYHEEIPPRVEYAPTELGLSLHPVYKTVCRWGEAKITDVKSANARYDRSHEESN